MSYKNKEDQNKNSAKWYQNNKERRYEAKKKRLSKNKKWFAEYKSKLKCKNCPENHPSCIDFHHREGEEKEKNISKLVHGGYSIKRILEEINKCDVLCANCHRKEHWDEWENQNGRWHKGNFKKNEFLELVV